MFLSSSEPGVASIAHEDEIQEPGRATEVALPNRSLWLYCPVRGQSQPVHLLTRNTRGRNFTRGAIRSAAVAWTNWVMASSALSRAHTQLSSGD